MMVISRLLYLWLLAGCLNACRLWITVARYRAATRRDLAPSPAEVALVLLTNAIALGSLIAALCGWL